VPGLIMLSMLTQSVSNASVAIYFPKFTRAIYEVLSAPLSFVEVVIAYVGAAATKSTLLALIILGTATLFVPVRILHPGWMVAFMLLTTISFSLFGFIIGIWAENFEQLAMSLFNPVVYLVSGFRWSFYGLGDVGVTASLAFTALFMALCLGVLGWMFRTGYRLKP
jgi:ABC-2 type transport system permease protein